MFAPRWILFFGAVQLAGCAALPRGGESVGRCVALEARAAQAAIHLDPKSRPRGLVYQLGLPRTESEREMSGQTAVLGVAWVAINKGDFPVQKAVVSNSGRSRLEQLPFLVPSAPMEQVKSSTGLFNVQAAYLLLPLRLLNEGEDLVVFGSGGAVSLAIQIAELRSSLKTLNLKLPTTFPSDSSPDPQWTTQILKNEFCF